MYHNLIFTEYQAKTALTTDCYLKKYLQQVAKEDRTVDTAGEFLKNHYDQFRKEVAKIGINMLHLHNLSEEVSEVVLENNSWAISKLFIEVMNASSDKPFIATKI